MNLEDIKKYDDYFWLRYLSEHTIFDTDNIKAQKDWLIAEVDRLQQDRWRIKEERDSWERVAFKVGQEKQQLQQENERYKKALMDISGYNGRYPEGHDCGEIAKKALEAGN